MEINSESKTKLLQEVKSGQRWDVAEDGTGHMYFYNADGDSVWELPNSSTLEGIHLPPQLLRTIHQTIVRTRAWASLQPAGPRCIIVMMKKREVTLTG